MKIKYCTCKLKGLNPEVYNNRCTRCLKKVFSFLDIYKKIRRSTLINTQTRVKKNDKLYDRKKAKRSTRKRISEEI